MLKMTMCCRTLGLNFSALQCHDRTRQHQGKRLLYMLKVALFCAKSLLQKNITCIFNLLFGHPLKFLGI